MDFTTNKPIYKQIIDFSFGQIISGVWQPGERVPSVRELSVQLSVNSHTVLKAYEFLQAEEIITPKRGMGFYLSTDAVAHVNSVRHKEFFDTTLCELFKEMRLLNISIEEVVKQYNKSLEQQ
ncbi:MAG: GntR family transcriptional regulator [Duncaniella sp.]|nr:GntR family transcriptional regulator [Duncaniella sp.]MDE6859581.1 GntR family transcriptional regulator [Duncaniella sp.]MDE7146593.1 GntR family transcriptional regulator [Duncaniella sp.]